MNQMYKVYGNRPPPLNGGKPKTESSFNFTIQTQTIMRLIGIHSGDCIICTDSTRLIFVVNPTKRFDYNSNLATLKVMAIDMALKGELNPARSLKKLHTIVHLQEEQYALVLRAAETHNAEIFESVTEMILP